MSTAPIIRQAARLALVATVACTSRDAAPAAGGGDSLARADSAAVGTAPSRATGDTLPPRIIRHDVIVRGTHGMRSRVRWLLSPDRLTVIAVEDPVSIEAEPLPNGVVYASETRSAVLQMDDVWDAAPSPDWRHLAYGRAFILRGEFRDSAAANQWAPLAQRFAALAVKRGAPPASEAARAQVYERELKRAAFPVSGMAIMYAASAAYVAALDSLPTGARAHLTDTLPPTRFGGWRVRWLGADTLAIGGRPAGARDEASPRDWTLVPVIAGDSLGAPLATIGDSSRLAPLTWQDGPAFSATEPLGAVDRSLEAGSARVESRAGTIYLTRRGDAAPIVVGPGTPYAATANGRFIVALAPADTASTRRSPDSAAMRRQGGGHVATVYEVIP